MVQRFLVTLIFIALAAPAALAKQVALIIGNTNYLNAPALDNPQNDARAIDARLRDLGFETTLLIDASLHRIAEGLGRFEDALTGADAALFFFAGHGMQMGGENYLLGVEAAVQNQFSLDAEAVRLSRILDLMEERAALSMAFIDACRDNPLAMALQEKAGGRARSLGLSRGLAPLNRTYRDTLVAYATAPGAVAYDGTDANSPFTAALLKHIGTPGIEVSTMLKRVTGEVLTATNGAQQPEVVTQMSREFYFKGTVTIDGTVTLSPDRQTREDMAQSALENARRVGAPEQRATAYGIVARDYPDTIAGELAALLAAQTSSQAQPDDSRDVSVSEGRQDFASLLSQSPTTGPAQTSLTPAQAEDALNLTLNEFRDIQTTLNALGFDAGPEDGRFGPRSRDALKAFQVFAGLTATGYMSSDSFDTLAARYNAAPPSLDGAYLMQVRRRWDDQYWTTTDKPDPFYAPGRIEPLANVRLKLIDGTFYIESIQQLSNTSGPWFEDFTGSVDATGKLAMRFTTSSHFGDPTPFLFRLRDSLPKRFMLNRAISFEPARIDPAFLANIEIKRLK